MLFKNKKGGIAQMIFLVIFLLIVAVIGLLFYPIITGVNNAISDIEDPNSLAYSYTQEINANVPTVIDELVLFLFLAMTIGAVVGAIKTDFSIGFMIIYLAEWIFAIAMSVGAVEIYQGFATSPNLVDLAQNLTVTNVLFSQYMPMIICIIGGLVMIFMAGKSGSEIK